MLQRRIIALLCFSFFLTSIGVAQGSQVVNISPSSASALTAGQSVTYSISLSNPIICPATTTVNAVCDVKISLVNRDFSNLSLSRTQFSWQADTWFQQETFTATANLHLNLRRDETSTIVGVITSASHYYNGATFTVSQAIKAPTHSPHCN